MGEKFNFLDNGLWDSIVDDIRQGNGISAAAKHVVPDSNRYIIRGDDPEYPKMMTHKKEDFYFGINDEERITPGAGKSVVQDDSSVHSVEEANALTGEPVLLDADGYVFQRRNGEWFMAGAAFGSTEFSGSFPARKMVEK